MFKVDTLVFDDEKMQHYMAEVGRRICSERMKKGLSISALAEQSNLSVSCICKVESAQVEVGLRALLKIAVALDVPVSTFLEERGGQTKTCATTAEAQRFESLICGTDEEIVDAVLSMADELIRELDKCTERGETSYVR